MPKLFAVPAFFLMAFFAAASPVTAAPVSADDAGGHAATGSDGSQSSPDWLVGEEMCARPR